MKSIYVSLESILSPKSCEFCILSELKCTKNQNSEAVKTAVWKFKKFLTLKSYVKSTFGKFRVSESDSLTILDAVHFDF